MPNWVEACNMEDIESEDLIRFDYDDRSFVIYRTPDDRIYATDGHCTHQRVHLENGMVIGHLVECPKHNGRFDYTTGKAKRAPACVDLQTYPTKVEGNRILIQID